MDKFEEFIVKKYPNRSAKVLLHKLQDNDGTWFYAVKEVQDQSDAWQSRKAELDQAYADIETFAQAHQRECDIKVQIANELKEKDKRIEAALFQMRQQALSLKEDCDGYKDPVGICQSEGIDWCVRFLEKILRGEHEA
ncbi:hypothetical protein [Acinetobacter sp. ULE_I092]|uniref:hypothetical protein n=1 Tax=Acinetobacter sp. ULE_I092 TaxID=3373075 RepID=UPI003AF90CB5